MVILTFAGLVVNPIVRKMGQFGDKFSEITLTLKLINKDLENLNSNWKQVLNDLEEQRRVLEQHSTQIALHAQIISNLKEREDSE